MLLRSAALPAHAPVEHLPRLDDSIRRLQEYVYTKYVEAESPASAVDEVAAYESLAAWFSGPERSEDPDCFMPGVLAFELAFEVEEESDREHWFRRAKFWFEKWRTLAEGEAWEVVDDRLADIEGYFDQRGISHAPEPPTEPTAPEPAPTDAAAPTQPASVEVEVVAPRPAPAAPPAPPAIVVHPVAYSVREMDDHGPMLHVPAGAFYFGPDKRPVHVPSFWIDKFPVTNRQYEAFCRATNYRFPKYVKEGRFAHPDAPVVGVSVADAQKYARWVGKALPTEEQWEKAARGVDGRAFPWGEEARADDRRACHGRDPAKGGTQSVQASAEGASPYGVRDLAGNVWEWTASTLEDGETLHVIKGGCYNDPLDLLRADMRLEAAPKDKHETIGFRLVKSA
jgi:serine/threonine-protein kinase